MENNVYRIMITSLSEGDSRDSVEYYYANNGERNIYCDALLSAEASCKYILANYPIDEIITLGSKTTYDPGDELVEMVLREGSSFYSSDIKSMSTYSLLRYRLAQYLDELRIEEQDLKDLLDENEQEEVMSAVKAAFRKNVQDSSNAKFSRFFDMLNRDEDLKRSVISDISETLDPDKMSSQECLRWVLNWLYSEMHQCSKMVALESNENVKISFIPTEGDGSISFALNLVGDFMDEESRYDGGADIELYICIQSEDADDTFSLMNLMDIIKAMPGNRIRIKRVVTSSRDLNEVASDIKDSTELYGVSELVAGARSFLRSGKTDVLINYWDQHRTNNGYIDRLLNAMRNIDIGISLCDISDIERGITSLRKLFAEEKFEVGPSVVEQYFGFIIAAIKEDYGTILKSEKLENIDLVKWAYRKGFWQQTLTFIEAKTPQDLVDKGIYYYSDGERSRDYAIKTFGKVFYDLKPFEKYKLDDISHYFVKFYGRDRVKRGGGRDEQLQNYSVMRVADLHTGEKNVLRAHTDCPDENALGNLLYAYYRIGGVRNDTNHAIERDSDTFGAPKDDSDVSERMNTIKESVESYIYWYDKVLELVGENGGSHVVKVTNDEVRAYANELKKKYMNSFDKKAGGDRKGAEVHRGQEGRQNQESPQNQGGSQDQN